jgi:hypothetical protein
MRYGSIPKGLKERLATVLGVVPYPMLDVLIAPLQARALIAAQRMSVFKALGEKSAITSDLAKSLALDESCLDLVLRLLSSMGYVERRAGRWSLSRLGRKHFGTGAPQPFRDFVAFGAPQWEWITRLDDVLKTGQGAQMHRTLSAPDWNLYQRAMWRRHSRWPRARVFASMSQGRMAWSEPRCAALTPGSSRWFWSEGKPFRKLGDSRPRRESPMWSLFANAIS